jgi:hypothetical protein
MKSRLLDFLGTTEAELAIAPAARVPFDRNSPAAILSALPNTSSTLEIIGRRARNRARRVPVLRQLVDGSAWLRKRNQARQAAKLQRALKAIVEESYRLRKENEIETLLVQKAVLQTQLDSTKQAYDGLAESLHSLQRRYDTMLSGISGRLSMMEWGGARHSEAGTRTLESAGTSSITTRYLDLLESSLTGTLINDASISPWADKGFNPQVRFLGRDWPEHAQTMIGTVRMRNIRYLLEKAIADDVPGDVIETGVWRGGACIYMRAILMAHNQTDRVVWVADSFAGLPVADAERYPLDAGDTHHTFKELAISLEDVQTNFSHYGLLDQNVKFLKGWFEDTLPAAPIERLAILRLDGDMYSSTIQALDALYHKVSPGGFVIVDDYILPACRKAVDEFRAAHGINDEMREVDGAAVFWQKSK